VRSGQRDRADNNGERRARLMVMAADMVRERERGRRRFLRFVFYRKVRLALP
jgi:hypothetical protein